MPATSAAGSCDTCGALLAEGVLTCPRCGSPIQPSETFLGDMVPTRTPALTVASRIANRYTIIKVLGRGGMGIVYHAWDDALGVPVALKTILSTPGLPADPRLEQRFKQEIRLARTVSHPNVVRIHDMGEVEGTKYITMAYIEGEPLSQLLAREGPLAVPRSLALISQIAQGVAAAHAAGVVHRDLKPENVMVTPTGDAVVMDFGIACATAGAHRTMTGALVGTLPYMAPEQALGQPVDTRADVYAMGLMLFDMLAGRRRREVEGGPMAELLARTRADFPPPAAFGIVLPEPLQALICRCTRVSSETRFENAAALAAALAALADDGQLVDSRMASAKQARRRLLRSPIAALVVALALSAAAWVTWVTGVPSPVVSEPPSARATLSVLIGDFANRVGDPAFDHLVEQALAVGIESSPFISAFPRRDAIRAAALLPGGRLDEGNARLVAIREGLDVVVTGQVDAAPSGYRIGMRAVRPADENPLLLEWSTPATGKDDVLPAVGRLAARLRSALGDARASVDHVLAHETFTATSLDAAQAYVQAQELFAAGQQEPASEGYRRALALDPSLGRAWAGLGAVANNQGRRGDAEEAYRRALASLDRMTERERLRTRGAYWVVTRNWQKAQEENESLVTAFPSDVAGLSNLAVAFFGLRQFDRARDLGARAAAIYPNNVLRQNNVALFSVYAGDFAAADQHARHVLTLNERYPKARVALAMSLAGLDRLAEAEAVYSELWEVPGGSSLAALGLADLRMFAGRPAAAADALERGVAREGSPSVRGRLLVTLAEVRLLQGRPSDAGSLALRSVDADADDPIVAFEAGRLLLRSGRKRDAAALLETLARSMDAEVLSLASLLAAEAALADDNPRTALTHLDEARKRADSWLGRVIRARALLAAGRAAEADSELEASTRRRGEAAATFLDDYPTWRRTAEVQFYQSAARRALGSPTAADGFHAFLKLKAGGDETGGLVAEARQALDAMSAR